MAEDANRDMQGTPAETLSQNPERSYAGHYQTRQEKGNGSNP
jgi:hypothetical protein